MANKLVPVGVVVRDVPSLDTKGHNVVEDTLYIEPGLSWYEGNEVFFVTIQVDRLKTEDC